MLQTAARATFDSAALAWYRSSGSALAMMSFCTFSGAGAKLKTRARTSFSFAVTSRVERFTMHYPFLVPWIGVALRFLSSSERSQTCPTSSSSF